MKHKLKIGDMICYKASPLEDVPGIVLEVTGKTVLFYHVQKKKIYNTSLLFLEDTDYIVVVGNIKELSQLEILILIL